MSGRPIGGNGAVCGRRGGLVAVVAALTAAGISLLAPPLASGTAAGANGRIAFSSYGDIYTVLPDGSELMQVRRPLEEEKTDFAPAWSADGTRIATGGQVLEPDSGNGTRYWSDTNLHLFRADGSEFTRLSSPNQNSSASPAWSPDGARIAYVSDVLGASSIYTVAPDGSDVRLLVAGSQDRENSHPAWSPDGSRIVFSQEVDTYGETDLYTMRPDGSDVRRLLARPGLDSHASWSPDGSTIAFSGTGPREGDDVSWHFPGRYIYVVPANGGEPRRITDTARDAAPAWAPDGAAIVFQREQNTPSGGTVADLYLMGPDGSNQRRLTNIGCLQCDPDWQRVSAAGPGTPLAPSVFGARTRVTLKLAVKRIAAGGPLTLLVSNQNGFQITGNLSGETANRVSASRMRRIKTKTKTFRVGARANKAVKMALPNVLRRLLKRKRKLKLRLTAVVKDPAGQKRRVVQKVSPELRKKRRR